MASLPPDLQDTLEVDDGRPSIRVLRVTLDTVQEFCAYQGGTLWVAVQRPPNEPREIWRVLFRRGDRVLLYDFANPSDTADPPVYTCHRAVLPERRFNELVRSSVAPIKQIGEDVTSQDFAMSIVANARWLIDQPLH